MSINYGEMISEAQLKAACEAYSIPYTPIDPRVYDMSMVGGRLLVLRDPNAEDYSTHEDGPRILLPESAKTKDPPGAGIVIAAGDMVGAGTGPHPHGLQCTHPSDLIGAHITFGMWAGKEFRVGLRDEGFKNIFWIITDRDIWAID